MNERMTRVSPEWATAFSNGCTVILAGIDEQEALSGAEMETLQRELRMLLQFERFQIAAAEVEKAEQVLDYMLRPNMEECLNLWFGKYEADHQEIWNRFGADVALASRGHYDHWALNVEYPRLLVALVIMLDQFRRNMYRDTPEMYASDARCLSLVKRGLRVGVGRGLALERVFLCLALTHSEALEDQQLCMEEWGRAMEELTPDDPLNAFHGILSPPCRRHHALRPGPPPQQGAAPGEHPRRGGVPAEQPLPLRPAAGAPARRLARLRRHTSSRTVKLLDHEYHSTMRERSSCRAGAASSTPCLNRWCRR